MAMDEATRAASEILESTSAGVQEPDRSGRPLHYRRAGSRDAWPKTSGAPCSTAARQIEPRARRWCMLLASDRRIEAGAITRMPLRSPSPIGPRARTGVAGEFPRDLGQLRRRADRRPCACTTGLSGAPVDPTLLSTKRSPPSRPWRRCDLLSRALVPSAPDRARQWRPISATARCRAHELRARSGDARRAIAAMEARYRRGPLGSRTLENPATTGVWGYFH